MRGYQHCSKQIFVHPNVTNILVLSVVVGFVIVKKWVLEDCSFI